VMEWALVGSHDVELDGLIDSVRGDSNQT
jgi:hypothetical protein